MTWVDRVRRLLGVLLTTRVRTLPARPAPKKKYFSIDNRENYAAVTYRGAVGYVEARVGYGPRKYLAYAAQQKPLMEFDTKQDAIEWLRCWRLFQGLNEDGMPATPEVETRASSE
jgi:hypothetical protein